MSHEIRIFERDRKGADENCTHLCGIAKVQMRTVLICTFAIPFKYIVSFVFGRAAATLGRTTWSQTNSRDVADSILKKIELGHNWAKTATWHDMVAGRNFGPHGTT